MPRHIEVEMVPPPGEGTVFTPCEMAKKYGPGCKTDEGCAVEVGVVGEPPHASRNSSKLHGSEEECVLTGVHLDLILA